MPWIQSPSSSAGPRSGSSAYSSPIRSSQGSTRGRRSGSIEVTRAGPRSSSGIVRPTARAGADASLAASARLSHPVRAPNGVAVPFSSTSCPSKWDRRS